MYIPPLPHLPAAFAEPHDPSDAVFEAENAYVRGLLERFGSDTEAPDELIDTINELNAIFFKGKEFALESDDDLNVFIDYIFFIMEAALLPVEMDEEAYDAIIDYANDWLKKKDEKGMTGLQNILQELHQVSIVHAGFVIANRILESINHKEGHAPQFTLHSASGATLH